MHRSEFRLVGMVRIPLPFVLCILSRLPPYFVLSRTLWPYLRQALFFAFPASVERVFPEAQGVSGLLPLRTCLLICESRDDNFSPTNCVVFSFSRDPAHQTLTNLYVIFLAMNAH